MQLLETKLEEKNGRKKIEQWEVSHKKWERSIANIKNETFCQIRKQEIVTLLENRDPETIYNNENKSVAKKGITEEWFLFYIKKQIELMGGTLSLNYKIQRSYIKKHLTKEMMLGDLLNPVFTTQILLLQSTTFTLILKLMSLILWIVAFLFIVLVLTTIETHMSHLKAGKL
jgi:hypothetical protein